MKIRLQTFLFSIISLNALAQSNVVFSSSNLPIVVIDTHGVLIQDEPKIIADMGIIDNGVGNRNNVTDAYNNYNGKIAIEIRGSSSQMFPKKQYGFELEDETGNTSIKASLLGFPKEEDWILSAPYNDKSLLRDPLSYKLGRDLGHYAPHTKHVEVVLNGTYQGVYILIEKIKRDKSRVNIEKLDPEEVSGTDVTGGYIIKIDKTTGNSSEGWFSSHPPLSRSADQKIQFQYEYPKYDKIVPEQAAYIQNYIAQFENALAGDNFKDPAEGYAKYIDVNSFVDFFIAQEIAKNIDGYRLSTFFYKESDAKGGKIFMGPIWDFNLGFGNDEYCDGWKTSGFVTNYNILCNQDFWLVPFWWKRLYEDDVFKQKMIARWAQLRAGKFQTSTIHNDIDSTAAVLNSEAQQRNFTAWPVLGQKLWPNYFVGNTYQDEITWMKNWIDDRLTWLDNNMNDIVTGNEEPVTHNTVLAFPNPFTNSITIQYTIDKPGLTQFQLINTLGSTVSTTLVENTEPGVKTFTMEPSISGGLYYFVVKHNGILLGKSKLSHQ